LTPLTAERIDLGLAVSWCGAVQDFAPHGKEKRTGGKPAPLSKASLAQRQGRATQSIGNRIAARLTGSGALGLDNGRFWDSATLAQAARAR